MQIIRVQTQDDGFANTPTDPTFRHVGHTILLCSTSSSLVKSIPQSSSDQGKKKEMTALALKFDKPSLTKSTFFKKKKNHANHNMSAYLSSMLQFSQGESSWATEFVGENVGRGVQGWKNEKRNVV